MLFRSPETLVGWEQETNPQLDYDQHYHVAGLVQHERWGRTRADGVFAFVDYQQSTSMDAAEQRLHEQTLQLREDLVTAPNDAFSLAYGLEAKGSRTTLLARTEQAWPELSREATLLARGVEADEDVLRATGGVYAEGRVELGPIRLVPGLRLGYDTLTTIPTLDPRLLARWEISPDTHLRAGAGIYSQYPTIEQLSDDVGDPGAGPARANQVAVGFDHAIAGRWEVGVDAWAKSMEGLFVTELDGTVTSGVEGKAWGVELVSRYRIRDRFFTSVAFSFGHATRGGEVFDYDQPWAGNVLASWNFAPTWNAGIRYRVSAGLPYTPIEDGLYLGATDTYAPVYGERNSARYVTYMKFDGHVEKELYTRFAKITLYTELWYVPAFSNEMYLTYRYDYDDSAPVAGPGFIPLVGLRAEH